MHYSGDNLKFQELSKIYRKAVEMRASIESLAYIIAKTKHKDISFIAQQLFNQYCEEIFLDKNRLDKAMKQYIQSSFSYLDANDKYLYVLQEASKLAIKYDLKIKMT